MRALITLLIILPLFSLSQVNVDSLKLVWNDENQPDTIRINAINDLIWGAYLYSQPDSAFYFAQQGYELAKYKELKKEMAILLTTQGISFMVRGDYAGALKYYNQSLKINEEISNKHGISGVLNNIGKIYMKQGDYASSIEYLNRSLLISENISDKHGIAQSLLSIALIYYRVEEYEKALDYNTRCLNLSEELGDKESLAKCYNNIGIIYYQKEDYKKALNYYNQAIVVQDELGNETGIGSSFGNIGLVYALQGNSASAIKYLKRSFEIFDKVGDKERMAGSLSNIGEMYLRMHNYDSAIIYSYDALKLAQDVGSAINVAAAADVLYVAYKSTGENNKALDMYELFVEINDSLQSKENQDEIIHQEYKHKYRQKHIADSLKNAQALELEKLNRQKEAERAKNQRYVLLALFCFVLIVIGIIFKVRSIKIRAEKNFLLKEIEILKSEAVIYMASSNKSKLKGHLDRDKIDSAIDGSLNDSDWNVLTLLCEKPTINNREIAEQISLSFEGVRSSLKKMYRIFDIQNSSENQRIALVIQAIRISNR